MPQAVIVVPCFNEERRLDADALLRLCDADTSLVLVDDGSTDGTRAALDAIAARAEGKVKVLALARNAGKGEAVRRGLLEGLARGAQLVGYVDADLSTPVEEVLRLRDEARVRPQRVVLGSRVQLLGRRIERSLARHYLGRIFATAASLALALRVYDTQCGAKFFRASDQLGWALAKPFRSRWAFDVELLGRLTHGGPDPYTDADLLEVPLRAWRDVKGSKLKPASAARAALDLALIARELRRR